MRERIFLTPYITGAIEKPMNCVDGLTFGCEEPCVFIANKPVPPDSVTYIELEIFNYTPLKGFRNLPVYLGIHGETSMGILLGECAFCSLFIDDTEKNYHIFEHYGGETFYTYSRPTEITSRIPAKKEYIGLCIDSKNDKITIYREGEVLYSFTLTRFSFKDGTFYPAIHVVNKCDISGRVNFGKVACECKPNNIVSFYGYYYKRLVSSAQLAIEFMPEVQPPIRDLILVELESDSDIIAGQEVPLFLESETATWRDDEHRKFHLDYIHTDDYAVDGHTVVSNKPIPYQHKVYLEWRLRQGVLRSNTGGIPISVGLTSNKLNCTENSIRIEMCHHQQARYRYKETYNGTVTTTNIVNLLTSIAPNQSMWIGMAFDLYNREFTVYINNIPFYTVHIDHLNLHPAYGEHFYFMLHDDGFFDNTSNINAEVNFGQESMHTIVPEGYMTLWNYYNHFYRMAANDDNQGNKFAFYYWAFPYKQLVSTGFPFSFTSISLDMIPPDEINNGMNKWLGTYNFVSDKEEHYFDPDNELSDEDSSNQSIDLRDMIDNLIREDNHGYTTENEFDKRDTFFGDILFPANWSF